jgi:preprotein translocase subunit SecE
MIERMTNYMKSVRQELSRVSWPTRNEIITLTALILLLAILLTLYIWGVDGIIGTVLRFFIQVTG